VSLRVLHVATRHRLGGAERNLLYTISRELDRSFDVHVAVGTEGLQNDFPPQVHLHLLPDLVREVSPVADRRAVRSLRAVISNHRFDVVHTHQSKAGALGRIAAGRLVPLVVHTVHMASFGPAYGRARSELFFRVERRLAPLTDRFVFVGTDLRRRYLAAGVAPPDRSIVIRSPITNLTSLIELRNLRGQLRDRARFAIGVPAERQVILMMGALDRRKRQALAIKSLAPLLAAGTTHLVIAGDGPERGHLEQVCSRLRVERSVLFAGFVRDVRPFYAAADVLVQASMLEGVAQTIVQAIAAGVPVVATEVDGMREVASEMSHVSVLPLDGRGLLETVRASLAASCVVPAPQELVEQWLPASVDTHLVAFHDWLEAQVCRRQRQVSALPRMLPALATTATDKEQVLR
jgi:glycosyltransferase involved in cell wall biosynthesis